MVGGLLMTSAQRALRLPQKVSVAYGSNRPDRNVLAPAPGAHRMQARDTRLRVEIGGMLCPHD